jgi:hypothetical protein
MSVDPDHVLSLRRPNRNGPRNKQDDQAVHAFAGAIGANNAVEHWFLQNVPTHYCLSQRVAARCVD